MLSSIAEGDAGRTITATTAAAEVRVPREEVSDCYPHCTTVGEEQQQKDTSFPISNKHSQHYSYSHFHQQRHMYPMTHSSSSPSSSTKGVPLLPPHIHSILYHSMVGQGGKLLPLPQTGGKKATSMSKSPSAPTARPHNMNYTQQQREFPLCETTAFTKVNITGTEETSSVISPGVLLSQGPTLAPSPYSMNTSLGNGSGSPSTIYGLQATDTKRDLYPSSSSVYSPGIYSPHVHNSSRTGLTDRALEELQTTDHNELVKILLELSSCNLEAARFIESKIHLNALRHHTEINNEHYKKGNNVHNTNIHNLSTRTVNDETTKKSATTTTTTTTNMSTRTKVFTKPQQRVNLNQLDYCSTSAHATPSKPLAFEDDSFLSNSCNKNGSVMDISSRQTSFCNSSPIQTVLLTPLNQCALRKEQSQRKSSIHTNILNTPLTAEERPWCSDVHPCLYWYGSCRHAASCPFTLSPQNLCLNWVRGSCIAGTNCSGVHRLPDECSSAVRTIFELSYGADRDVVAREKFLQQQQQKKEKEKENRKTSVVMECVLHKNDSPVTPKDQIVVNPVSIPASLEHYHHVLRLSDDETVMHSQNQEEDNQICNCRSCCAWSDKFDWDSELQYQESCEHVHYPQCSLLNSVPRCLDDSFAAAAAVANAYSENNVMMSTVKDEEFWIETRRSPTCQYTTECEGDSEEEAMGFPPCNVLTRTQSPVAL